jgi:hypothetical protein
LRGFYGFHNRTADTAPAKIVFTAARNAFGLATRRWASKRYPLIAIIAFSGLRPIENCVGFTFFHVVADPFFACAGLRFSRNPVNISAVIKRCGRTSWDGEPDRGKFLHDSILEESAEVVQIDNPPLLR